MKVNINKTETFSLLEESFLLENDNEMELKRYINIDAEESLKILENGLDSIEQKVGKKKVDKYVSIQKWLQKVTTPRS